MNKLSFSFYDQFALYNVIDDISYKTIKTETLKSLVGGQSDFIVNVKYGKDRIVKGGLPCIILVNPDMDWNHYMSPQLKDWWHSNVIEYYLYENEKFY